MSKTSVLFVCLGNICRSPTAEGVFRAMVQTAGRTSEFEIDSAGTGGWHAGHEADPRMQQAARARGYVLESRARQVGLADFGRFDHIIAMDHDNLETLEARAPRIHTARIYLLRSLDNEAPDADVPDPYYGGKQGFDEVVSIVERCCQRLLETL